MSNACLKTQRLYLDKVKGGLGCEFLWDPKERYFPISIECRWRYNTHTIVPSTSSSVLVLLCQRRGGGEKMTAAGVASEKTKKLFKLSLSLFRLGFNSSKWYSLNRFIHS